MVTLVSTVFLLCFLPWNHFLVRLVHVSPLGVRLDVLLLSKVKSREVLCSVPNSDDGPAHGERLSTSEKLRQALSP